MNQYPGSSDSEGEKISSLSLRELIDMITGQTGEPPVPQQDSGISPLQLYPFMAIVGQEEMKTALLLALINPMIGGVLLIGARGTGKTTAIRGLVDLLPPHTISNCYYGCLPEDIESGGMDAVCPDCARKFGQGLPLTRDENTRLIELPLNARLEDVIGGIDERAAIHDRLRFKRGLLSQADQNILYIDEVNLLSNDIVNAILDASALGSYTVRRGPISSTYKARFTLIGSMNPEEGQLRSQILDRFGLRVIVQGLKSEAHRLEAYRRVNAFRLNPALFIARFKAITQAASDEIEQARQLLPHVELPDQVAKKAVSLVKKLRIDSLRAEITLLEAARAFTAADGRSRVKLSDVKHVLPMALRLRRSEYIERYLEAMEKQDSLLLGESPEQTGGQNG